MHYGLKLAGVLIAAVIVFALGIVLFERVWYRIGLGAAILVISVPLLIYAWYVDKKRREEREGLEDI